MNREQEVEMRLITTSQIICLIIACLGVSPSLAVGQDFTTEPATVRLVLDDIRQLAEVLRSLRPADDTSAVLERSYLANGSPGLRAYAQRYDVTGATIASALKGQPSLYASLDALADSIFSRQDELRSGFRQLRELFPEAVFPPIWFFVGGHGVRGLARPEGVLICAEGFSDQTEGLLPLVLHELAHIQAAIIQGIETYRRIFGPDQTLLALALREGTAELIAELATGRHTNPEAERYGLMHEAELWQQFRADMHNREPGDWMFVRPANQEWPANLGYWIGYRIAKSYYERAGDKRAAIREILGVTDFTAFLEASGYAERMAHDKRVGRIGGEPNGR